VYYPHNCYPADDEIRSGYIESIRTLTAQAISDEQERGWIKQSPYIDFTVWDSGDTRTLYALNIDWKSDSDRSAAFVINNKDFSIPVKRYTIGVIHCSKNIAAIPMSNTSDIISIKEESGKWLITCQTTGEDDIWICNGISGEMKVHKVSQAGVHQIEIKN